MTSRKLLRKLLSVNEDFIDLYVRMKLHTKEWIDHRIFCKEKYKDLVGNLAYIDSQLEYRYGQSLSINEKLNGANND